MCECVTLQRFDTSHEVINDNDRKPTNHLLPFTGKEIIFGKNKMKKHNLKSFLFPQKAQKEIYHHVVIQMH